MIIGWYIRWISGLSSLGKFVRIFEQQSKDYIESRLELFKKELRLKSLTIQNC